MISKFKAGTAVVVDGDWFDLDHDVKCWILESEMNNNHSVAVTNFAGIQTTKQFLIGDVPNSSDYWFVPLTQIKLVGE